MSTGECKQTFVGHTQSVESAVFSGDGLTVLTASYDKTAKLWDAGTGESNPELAENGVMQVALYRWRPTSSCPSLCAYRRYGTWERAGGYTRLSSLVLSEAIASDPSELLSIGGFYSSSGRRSLVCRWRSHEEC